MRTKISFFFDSANLLRPWSFDVATQALSGTDVILLEVVNGLAADPDFQVAVYATSAPTDARHQVEIVADFSEAVRRAETNGEQFLVFIASSEAGQFEVFRQRRRSSLKFIAWAQCSPSFDWMTQAWSDARFFRLIAVSNIQRAFLAHHALYRKTVVIPNFLDLEAWESVLTDREPERKVVYVGALKPTKGFNHLANVWRAIRERHPDWTLSVCGSPGLYGRSAAMGPEGIAEADFERTILAPLGGSRRSAEALGVHFVGSLTKQDLAAEIRASAAVVVNPNTSQNGSIETFCVSAAEAMALGVPVIGGAAGGLLEVVAHGEGGLLAGDEAELQKALLALIENPARARELGLGGQERVRRHFTKARAIERWRDLLSGRPIAADTLPAFKYGIWGYYLRVVCGWVLPLRVVQMVRDGRRNILTGFRS